MKTLILYASARGSTEKAASLLKDRLGDAVIANITRGKIPDIEGFEAVIIGGSIHMGRIQKQVKAFCESNLEALKSRKLGLFICCMREGEMAQEQFETAYPEVLRKHAVAKGLFGGEFVFSKMSFLQKAIIKKVSGHSQDVSTFSVEAIDDFTKAFK